MTLILDKKYVKYISSTNSTDLIRVSGKIDWISLFSTNSTSIYPLEANPEKNDWDKLSKNLPVYDIKKIPESLYKENIARKAFHPKKLELYLRMGSDLSEF